MEVFIYVLFSNIILDTVITYLEVAVLDYAMFLVCWELVSLLKFKGIMMRKILHSINSSTQHV